MRCFSIPPEPKGILGSLRLIDNLLRPFSPGNLHRACRFDPVDFDRIIGQSGGERKHARGGRHRWGEGGCGRGWRGWTKGAGVEFRGEVKVELIASALAGAKKVEDFD